MALIDKVLSLDEMRQRVSYYGSKIDCRVKRDHDEQGFYLLENGWLVPIWPDSGNLVHILYMQEGFPIDISRRVFEEKGWAIDEEQLQIGINEELVKQLEAKKQASVV